jgi:glycerol kinase
MSHILSLDQGTTSSRAILFDQAHDDVFRGRLDAAFAGSEGKGAISQ